MFNILFNLLIIKFSGFEAKQITDVRIAKIFNKLSPSEFRPQLTCTYRIFQMQQTHKSDPLQKN